MRPVAQSSAEMAEDALTIKDGSQPPENRLEVRLSMEQRVDLPSFNVRRQPRIQSFDLPVWVERQKRTGSDTSAANGFATRRPRDAGEPAGRTRKVG